MCSGSEGVRPQRLSFAKTEISSAPVHSIAVGAVAGGRSRWRFFFRFVFMRQVKCWRLGVETKRQRAKRGESSKTRFAGRSTSKLKPVLRGLPQG